MSVLWVRPKVGGKGGGQGERGSNHFRNEWTVKCDTPSQTRVGVLSCGMLPVYGSPHPENPNAVCVIVDARQQKDAPLFWDAEAEWQESPRSKQDPGDDAKQPDQRRPKWSSRYVPIPVSRFIDYGGHAASGLTGSGNYAWSLCDTAGTPFDPVPDMPIYAEEITIFQYEATARRSFKRAYMGAANTDSWQGASPGEALVDDIAQEDEFIQGVWWWATTYKILIKPRIELTLPLGGTAYVGGWDPEYILNAGPMALVQDSSGKWSKKPVTKAGYYDGRPALLDEYGREISLDKDTGKASADPIFLGFHTKRTAAFAGLALTPPPGWEDE